MKRKAGWCSASKVLHLTVQKSFERSRSRPLIIEMDEQHQALRAAGPKVDNIPSSVGFYVVAVLHSLMQWSDVLLICFSTTTKSQFYEKSLLATRPSIHKCVVFIQMCDEIFKILRES